MFVDSSKVRTMVDSWRVRDKRVEELEQMESVDDEDGVEEETEEEKTIR